MKRFILSNIAAIFGFVVLFSGRLNAQDHTVLFGAGDTGVTKAITNWGVSVTWPNYHNTRLSVLYMGDDVDFMHLAFVTSQPLTNGNLTAAMQTELQGQADMANLFVTKPWSMAIGTGSGVDPWYKSGGDVIASRWVQAMEAAQRFYNKPIIYVEPFNEPDYGWGQGTMANLYDIMGLLQTSTNFTGTILAGGSTLNTDWANPWYDAVKTRATAGTSHALGGTFNNYVSFMQNVIASGDTLILPEAHSMMEVIAGAEYGVSRGMFWGVNEFTRASFVKACQGKRLGYSEDRAKWTAAAVYRSTNGLMQAFLSGNERMGVSTSYRFFCKDRDVFYNGDGPRRDFTVSAAAFDDKLVNISSGADVPPVITGRFLIVNRNSGKVMEVASASVADGANVQQNASTAGTYQQWDVTPFLPAGGDQGYYSIKAAHSGKALDVGGGSTSPGGNVQQWTNLDGANQQWFFEYAGNGYFYIRNRWSGLYLEVAGASTSNGANIAQFSYWSPSPVHQQWRLIPTNAAVEFVAPAVPTGVTTTANELSVRLNWNAVAAGDLAGYTVLRATNSGGPYDVIARGITNTSFTDKWANQPRTNYYVVKAVDRSLNASANSAQVSAKPTVLPAQLARYTFDGNTNDSSVNANHAIVTVGTPTFVAGKYGSGAMDLDGTSQYTMLPANLFASVTNFTIAAWVNWDGGGAWQRIFDFGNDTTQYMFLTPSSGSGTLRFAVTTNGGGAEQIIETLPLPVGQWRHVAVTRNGNTAKLYTNGLLAASSALFTIPPANFNPVLNYLGASQWPDPLFNGRLDELFIYNYALTDTEVTRLANNLPPPPVAPTTLSSVLAGNTVTFSWPSNYLGCRLESNSVSLTSTGSWFTVGNSAATNQMSLPINSSAANAFFRLKYP